MSPYSSTEDLDRLPTDHLLIMYVFHGRQIPSLYYPRRLQTMLPDEIRFFFIDLPHVMFPGLDLYYKDPAQHSIP